MRYSLALVLAAGTALSACAAQMGRPAPQGTAAPAADALAQRIAGFDLDFTVLYRPDDPKMALRPAGIKDVAYNVATWRAFDPARADLAASKRDAATQGDGFDDRILDASAESRAADYFNAGEPVAMKPARVRREGDRLIATYPADPRFTLTAEVDLAAKPYPLLRWHLEAQQAGYFSVGYTGAPHVAAGEASEIWQPLIWQEKRLPDRPYLTLAYRATLPTAMVREGDTAFAAIAHPGEFPFQPLPLAENSRFGVAVRDRAGRASPMIFAPVIGGAGSKLEVGASTSFRTYLVREPAKDLTRLYERLARGVYGFGDFRHNAVGSLNATFDRIVDYSMSAYARWIADLKGSSYSTDVPGAVKNVSSLNPFELALVTDRPAMFESRVIPYVEYMLSREKFLFSLDPEQKIQNPSRALLGPTAPISELATLYAVLGRRNPALLDLAKREYAGSRTRNLDVAEEGRTWQNALSLFEATGDRAMLATAVEGADRYLAVRVDTPQQTFEHAAFFFWPAFVPDFVDLYRLYRASGQRRFLDAAQLGARRYTMFTWMAPAVPDADVTVNPGGKAPVYWYLASKGHKPMSAPQQDVPAWRLSEMGLTPESSGTSTGHRAIFMANYAPWLLRIAEDANDAFLHDVARSAVIGRYRNFPGYHINTARTTIYEGADYPLHEHEALSVNSFHYNHIWPMATMLLDYLVSDARGRSNGAIDFPSQFIEAYAYLQNGFYGYAPGHFYGDEGVNLWMPKGLLAGYDPELNYIAGYRGDALYVALANQSDKAITSRFAVAPELAQRVGAATVARLSPGGVARTDGDEFAVEVPARGQVALRIDGLRARPQIDRADLERQAVPVPNDQAALTVGDARAYLLDFGHFGRRAYVYLRDDDSKVVRARLRYRSAKGWRTLTDDAFPFEFSVPRKTGESFTFSLSVDKVGGGSARGAETVLGK